VLNQNINYITGHRYPWCVWVLRKYQLKDIQTKICIGNSLSPPGILDK
jgi:hypothetical protein